MNRKNFKQNVQSQFGQNAKGYVTSIWHKSGSDLAKLIEISNTNGNEYLLDIATGGGHVANGLAPKVKKVVAYDLTVEILEEARNFMASNGFKNVDFVQGDAEQLPFANETFDLITCRIAAHHFQNPNKFVNESYRTLKEGGTFLLIDNVVPERDDFDQFYNKVEKDRDFSHYRAWKKTEWFQMLEYAGFEIEEMYQFKKIFKFDEWCDRMNLPTDKKLELSSFMKTASQECKKKFKSI